MRNLLDALYKYIYLVLLILAISGCASTLQSADLASMLLAASASGALPLPPMEPNLGTTTPEDRRQLIIASLGDIGNPIQIGQSVMGNEINAYRFGTGDTHVLLVGGIHGSHEANTITLMRTMVEMFQQSTELIPEQVALTIVPNMNPDGSAKEGLSGRVNANQVDLNRNWDCNWKDSAGLYRGALYHTGERAFSEPETIAVRNLVDYINATVVIFYHSHGGFIFYGDCNGDDGSLELARAVKRSTGYPIWNPSHSLGDPNQPQITGDATDYFDRTGVFSIGIELTTHDEDNIDWEQSIQGLTEIMQFALEQ